MLNPEADFFSEKSQKNEIESSDSNLKQVPRNRDSSKTRTKHGVPWLNKKETLKIRERCEKKSGANLSGERLGIERDAEEEEEAKQRGNSEKRGQTEREKGWETAFVMSTRQCLHHVHVIKPYPFSPKTKSVRFKRFDSLWIVGFSGNSDEGQGNRI